MIVLQLKKGKKIAYKTAGNALPNGTTIIDSLNRLAGRQRQRHLATVYRRITENPSALITSISQLLQSQQMTLQGGSEELTVSLPNPLLWTMYADWRALALNGSGQLAFSYDQGAEEINHMVATSQQYSAWIKRLQTNPALFDRLITNYALAQRALQNEVTALKA